MRARSAVTGAQPSFIREQALMQADSKSLKRTAVAKDRQPDEVIPPEAKQRPRYQNNNGLEWPLLPFPRDWYSSP